MAENKTKATKDSVAAHLAGIASEPMREDARELVALFTKTMKCEPAMWGPSIIGFGSYHYRYDSGREGDSCLVGFAVRASGLAIYASADFDGRDALIAKLGKFKGSKGCINVKRLADIDQAVLAKIAKGAAAELKRRYPAKS